MTTLDKSFFQNGKAKRTLKPQKFSMDEIESGLVGYVARLGSLDVDMMEIQWSHWKKKHGTAGCSAFMVAWCLCDENNQRLFDTGQDEEKITMEFLNAVTTIQQWDGATIRRGFNVLTRLNGLSERDIEELEKNSEAPANDAGNGDKQVTSESHVEVG